MLSLFKKDFSTFYLRLFRAILYIYWVKPGSAICIDSSLCGNIHTRYIFRFHVSCKFCNILPYTISEAASRESASTKCNNAVARFQYCHFRNIWNEVNRNANGIGTGLPGEFVQYFSITDVQWWPWWSCALRMNAFTEEKSNTLFPRVLV